MEYQITHIVPDGADPDRRIDAIYGPICGYVSQEVAINAIDAGLASYFTFVGFLRAEVFVVRRMPEKPFLSTSRDGYGPNNLCLLPRLGG